ncbi:Peroxisome biogenesis protein 1 [Eumeta japonica]|uniref:Peroxisome biogenesis protein 1 n=1 Tax=Eumeta variegata TaxID=151549 RepID=A0A4C1ZQ21_EUMVA|nr:Peroxisome biogenesis protein 1 [Eumeta japonica]
MCQERGPAVLICDDVDSLVPPNMEASSPQDIAYYQRLAIVLKRLLQSCAGICVLMTALSVSSLHPILREVNGKPMYTSHFEMPSLDQSDRVELFKHLLNEKVKDEFTVADDDVIRLATETAGYNVRDLTDYLNKKIFKAVKRKNMNPENERPYLIEDVRSDKEKTEAFDVWGSIGGMDVVKQELTECIFWPIMWVHHILSKELHMKKLSARRAPRLLTVDQNELVPPSNLHLFPKLNTFLDGLKFETNDDVVAAVDEYFGGLKETHFMERITALERRQTKRVERTSKNKNHSLRYTEYFSPRPGTGKSYIGTCLAKVKNMNFIAVKGPELLSKYIGQSEKAVRDIFDKADSKRPCILFFDEFDALAPRRGHDSTGVTDRVVNQLLSRLDGAEGGVRYPVVAATARPDLLDPALLRAGRLQRHLYCALPDKNGRHEVMKNLAREINLSGDIDLEDIAARTEGFSPADLKSLFVTAQLGRLERQLDSTVESSVESLMVEIEDMEAALAETKPSLSEEQRLFYDVIYKRFRGESLSQQERIVSSELQKERVTLA